MRLRFLLIDRPAFTTELHVNTLIAEAHAGLVLPDAFFDAVPGRGDL
jgi:hypothetical protein